MSKGRVEKLKRRLVQQAVRDNLALIRGLDPAALRRAERRRRARRRLFTAGLLPVGLLASSFAISNSLGGAEGRHPDPQPQPAVAPPAPAADAVSGEEAADALDGALLESVLASREPIDPQVFPLAVRRVAVDPGHGGRNLGTRTPLGLMEKELTLDIGRRLESLLTDGGFEVLLTREGDHEVPLQERARLANEAGADIFVSIHVNWIDDRGTRGIETFYLGTTDDPFLNRLAAVENRDSGYSLSDLRRLLDRIYVDVRGGKSRTLAEGVQRSLYRSLSKVSPGLVDRGVKTAPFIVLADTEMPAILAEVSCLSSEREARLLAKPLYRQYIAEALAKGVRAYADGPEPAGQKGS